MGSQVMASSKVHQASNNLIHHKIATATLPKAHMVSNQIIGNNKIHLIRSILIKPRRTIIAMPHKVRMASNQTQTTASIKIHLDNSLRPISHRRKTTVTLPKEITDVT